MDVTAAILAGGLGTRLRSVVADRPKVLAPVANRPFLTHVLDQLIDTSVQEIILLTGYRAEQVRGALGEGYAGMRLIYADEAFPLGTAGALRRALPQISAPSLLLLNGDSCCEIDLAEFYQWHRRQSAGASLALVRVPDVARFGQVQRDTTGRIVRFDEKGKVSGPGWINAGVYFMERELLADLPSSYPLSLERDVLPGWIERQLVWGMECGGRLLDIGTPESYAEAEAFFGIGRQHEACAVR
jgi:NDP-sugar pyrophosphorylase family protein